MVIPHRHAAIAVNNIREGRRTTLGTCSTEVLVVLGTEPCCKEGGESGGAAVIADAGESLAVVEERRSG